jgi:hypothetical protein
MTAGMSAGSFYQSAVPAAGGTGGSYTVPTPPQNVSSSYPYDAYSAFGGGGGGGYYSGLGSGGSGAAGANGVVLVVTYF